MIKLDSDMSKSTNTVVYFDWKTVIYIYVCGKCRTQFMLPMEKLVTFTGACANEIIPSINRSFVYKAKGGRHVRITGNLIFVFSTTFISSFYSFLGFLYVHNNMIKMFDCLAGVQAHKHVLQGHNLTFIGSSHQGP